MAIRCLLLARHGALSASTRQRHLQYIPYLMSQGIQVDVHTLLDDAYLEAFYAGGRAWPSLVRAFLSRLRMLLHARRYDVLWIEKELFPFLPSWFEQVLSTAGVPYVVDYDDATFHRYDAHSSLAIRHLLGRKIGRVMRSAALVVAGNEYLASKTRLAGARRVEILPTVVDLDRYPEPQEVKAQHSSQSIFTVGWVGAPKTVKYLRIVEDALRAVAQSAPLRFVVVGASAGEIPGIDVVDRPWSEATEVENIRSFDVGIMPLADDRWERGKCGYKLIQYMACSKPVVASPVGVNKYLVQPGVNGFLANETAAWVSALEMLRADAGLRHRMGATGRNLVEAKYSLQVAAPLLAGWLSDAAAGR
jgi:glycosyltransferase involved in cell wall biosynthesis